MHRKVRDSRSCNRAFVDEFWLSSSILEFLPESSSRLSWPALLWKGRTIQIAHGTNKNEPPRVAARNERLDKLPILGEELNADNLFVGHSLNAAAERFENKDVENFAVENIPSEEAELQHYIGVTEDGTNHRLKVREKALKNHSNVTAIVRLNSWSLE